MPIYEYRCQFCGFELEVLQKMSDAPRKECPECEKEGLVKAISAPNFRLKGSGWYETDFKKEGDKRKNLADSGSDKPASESAKSETKSDKPAANDSGKKADTKATAAGNKAAGNTTAGK